MQFHDLFAVCQTDARTFIIRAVMQALEDDEYFVLVLLVDANAIIADRELPGTVLPEGLDLHFRSGAGFPEFDGIADQVLEQ